MFYTWNTVNIRSNIEIGTRDKSVSDQIQRQEPEINQYQGKEVEFKLYER